MGTDGLGSSEPADALLRVGHVMISVHTRVIIATMAASIAKGALAMAQDPAVVVNGSVIEISLASIVKSVDTATTVVYYVDERLQIVQLFCDTKVVGDFGVDVGPCRDGTGAGAKPVHLIDGGGTVPAVPQGSKRTYRVTLKNLVLGGSPPGNLDVSATVGGGPLLVVSRETNQFANRRELIVVPDDRVIENPEAVLRALAKNVDKIQIVYEFAKDDPVAPLRMRATAAALSPPDAKPTSLLLTPAIALPRRPKKYTVKVEIPIADSGVPASAFPADAKVLGGSTSVELVPTVVDRASSEFFLEAAYTSTVDAAKDDRTHAGVFAFHLKPVARVFSRGVDGSTDGSTVWWTLRPLLDADVDTRPLASSKVANKILFGLDHDFGWDTGIKEATRRLQQVLVTNGLHYESDRDFKLQTAYLHTEVRPVLRHWEQTRDQRAYRFTQWLARQKADTVTLKQPRVSTYYVRPSVANDLGGVVRDRNDANPYEGDTITRMVAKLDAGIEFLRTLAFGVTNEYQVIWNLDEDRDRNFAEIRVELNTGTLFRLDRNSLQHAIALKYQKGRQAPAYKPVDTLSLGIKLFR